MDLIETKIFEINNNSSDMEFLPSPIASPSPIKKDKSKSPKK